MCLICASDSDCEQDDLVHAVEEFGPEMPLHFLHHALTHQAGFASAEFLNDRTADVGGHNHDRIAEVHRPALPVCQASVVEQLQQNVEHVRVRFLDFVEQKDAVGAAANRFRELPALVVADVAGRCAEQTRYGVLLHVLAHVNPHHRPVIVEQKLRQRPRQFRFADSCRAEENERANRLVRVAQAGARTPHGIGNRFHGFVLPDNARCAGGLPFAGVFAFRLPAGARPECPSTCPRFRRCRLPSLPPEAWPARRPAIP